MVSPEGYNKAIELMRQAITGVDLLGMNGNYRAGVLEGVAHYFPETKNWLL